MTKLKPILFSTHMITAIMEGRKTQTRRIIKYKKKITDPNVGFSAFCPEGEFEVRGCHENGDYGSSFFKAPIMKRDILWVRETWQQTFNPKSDKWDYIYKADGGLWIDDDGPLKWKPSIFMPKEACRIFLKVTNVRVERLNAISDEDAVKEGILPLLMSRMQLATQGQLYNNYLERYESRFQPGLDPRESFKTLWESINGVGSWEKNPYVWVYEFERTEMPEVWP